MVSQGLFREDLLYRINTITIDIPPLRERNNDILLLADYFLKKFADKYNKPGLSITRSAYNKLLKYHWPGNVRELQHCMEKAVILAEDKVLNKENFTLNTTGQYKKTAIPFETLEEMEKQMIITTLKKEKGNMSLAAKKLGITRQTLYNKLNKYGI
jgi:DNA-binding NtrC family response regulator